MPKIISKEAIKNGCSLISETKNGYFVNNNYYNKNFNPVPFKITAVPGNSDQIQTIKSAIIRNVPNLDDRLKYRLRQNYTPLTVVDQNDPSISYSIFSNYMSFSKEVSVIKYTENEDEGIKIFNSTSFGGTDFSSVYPSISPYAILAQTKKYIFFACSYRYHYGLYSDYRNYCTMILRYSKEDATILPVFNDGNSSSSVMPLISNKNEIYYYYHYASTSSIMKYNIDTNKANEVKRIVGTSLTGRTIECVNIIDENKIEFIHPALSSSGDVLLKKIELDISQVSDSNKVKETDITIAYNDTFTNTTVPNYSNSWLMYHCFENIASNGATYYNIAIYTIDGTLDGKEYQGVYTYKKMQNGSLEAKGFTIFSNVYFTTGLLLSNNKNWFISGSNSTVSYYYFDEVQEKYIKKNDFNGLSPLSMGLDKNENIWIIDGQYNTHCFSSNIAKDVILKLDKKSYKFEGSEIQGSVSITCKNYKGDAIATDLILEINGPAIFADNNLKTINISVTEEQPLVVPIIINDSGDFTVSSKIIL